MQETPPRIRIEVDLPGHLTAFTRRSLLTALANADRYGHDVTTGGATVWAEIDRNATDARPRRGG
jgi:hypothetical protein